MSKKNHGEDLLNLVRKAEKIKPDKNEAPAVITLSHVECNYSVDYIKGSPVPRCGKCGSKMI